MKIRIKVKQPSCAHSVLTLRGIDLKGSTERYTCNVCGEPVVRPLKPSVSYWLARHYHPAETSPPTPSGSGNDFVEIPSATDSVSPMAELPSVHAVESTDEPRCC